VIMAPPFPFVIGYSFGGSKLLLQDLFLFPFLSSDGVVCPFPPFDFPYVEESE